MSAPLSLIPREHNLPRAVEFMGGWPGHVFSLGRCVRCHRHVWDDPTCTAWDPWKWLGDALTFARQACSADIRFRLDGPDGGNEWSCVAIRQGTTIGASRDASAAVAITEALCQAIGWNEQKQPREGE